MAESTSDGCRLPCERSCRRQPVRHEVVTHVLGTWCYLSVRAGQKRSGGEGGILCQGPRDLENCNKTSVSGQPRRVVCTGSMYRNRRLSSSGFRRMANAFHRRERVDARSPNEDPKQRARLKAPAVQGHYAVSSPTPISTCRHRSVTNDRFAPQAVVPTRTRLTP
jgi:hypothetical protein